jgi:hypothetical protein
MLAQLKSLAAAALLAGAHADAALYTFPFSPGDGVGSGLIPDANPTGWYDTRTISGLVGTIESLTINLTLGGGWNSDLYAALVHFGNDNQTTSVILLNRIGITPDNPFGNTGSELIVRLCGDTETDYPNIHDADSGSVTGNYNPDNASGSFTAFNGINPNGNWTLFFADLSGGNQSTVSNWSLDIAVVPEPVGAALATSAGLLALIVLARNRKLRHRLRRWRSAVDRWIDAV